MIKIFCDACGKEINPDTEGFRQYEGYIYHDISECTNKIKLVKLNPPSILQVDFTDKVKYEIDATKTHIKKPWWMGILRLSKITW